jgi:hypothetical protein
VSENRGSETSQGRKRNLLELIFIGLLWF